MLLNPGKRKGNDNFMDLGTKLQVPGARRSAQPVVAEIRGISIERLRPELPGAAITGIDRTTLEFRKQST